MTVPEAPENDSKRWLVWLALGVVLALVGPTWLYNWKFNPENQVPEPPPPPAASEVEPTASGTPE
jgi:cytoskeletal protein RodZ